MKKVEIYTDGSCSGNPGPGGWGAILRYRGTEKELSGGAPATTNNRMELTAVIEALSALKQPCAVDLYTDSRYIASAIREGWLENWKARGWKKADSSPVLNRELWEALDGLLSVHAVTFHWVKGHADNACNNRCDALATAQTVRYKAAQES
ncbi:MAG: ribonuclease HI [Clostridia bacterium]|nr:ribonuclease HI [Clostridia bacterium]